jgi:hypothetical protein
LQPIWITSFLDRQLRPSLKGTYGSSLTFWKGKALNDVLFSFVIGDAFCGYSVTSEYKVEGTFQIDPETLNSLVVFFKGCHAGANLNVEAVEKPSFAKNDSIPENAGFHKKPTINNRRLWRQCEQSVMLSGYIVRKLAVTAPPSLAR